MMVVEGGRRRGRGGLDILMGKRDEGTRGLDSERSVDRKNLTRFLKSSLCDVRGRVDPARRSSEESPRSTSLAQLQDMMLKMSPL